MGNSCSHFKEGSTRQIKYKERKLGEKRRGRGLGGKVMATAWYAAVGRGLVRDGFYGLNTCCG